MPEAPESRRPIKRETLADQVAADITEQIMAGTIASGSALPTEPQLAEAYGVSRSAIRDATRLLLARGLVEVQHGKGVFATSSQKGPFADALMLALRRDGATAWDVDEFMEWLLVVAVSLAMRKATDEEIDEIERRSVELFAVLKESNEVEDMESRERVVARAESIHDALYEAIFAATHNKALEHVAYPLLALRRLREWDLSQVTEGIAPFDLNEVDRRAFTAIVACLRSRDPSRLSEIHALIGRLPEEAVNALKQTPVGEVARIVITEVPKNWEEVVSG